MTDKRHDLRAALRGLAAEESADAGEHIRLPRLIAYRDGSLPAAERETIQEHLSLCPRCTRLLLELRDFEADAAQGGIAGAEPLKRHAWEALSRRLPAAASGQSPVVRPIAGAGRREAPPRRVARFAYAAAAALLLLAVVGLGVWAASTAREERQRLARLEQMLEEREASLATVRSSLAATERQLASTRGRIERLEKEIAERAAERVAASREAARGGAKEPTAQVAGTTPERQAGEREAPAPRPRADTTVAAQDVEVTAGPRFSLRGREPVASGFLRGGGAVNPVSIPPQADRFTVAIDLADHPVYDEYRLELMAPNGVVLWSARRPASAVLGDAGTWLSVDGPAPGRYRLRVEGLRPDRTDFLAEYVLEVERRNTPP